MRQIDIPIKPNAPIVTKEVILNPKSKVEINDRVFVIDEKTGSTIIRIDSNRIVFRGKPNFRALRVNGTGNASEMKVGDILVAGPLENAADGLLVKVKSFFESGDDTIVETEEGSFLDIFKNIDIDESFELFSWNDDFETTVAKDSISPVENNSFGITMNAALKANSRFILKITDGNFQKTGFTVSATPSASLGIAVNYEMAFERMKRIFARPMSRVVLRVPTPIPLIPFIPIVLNPTLALYVKGAVSVKESVKIDNLIKIEKTFQAGVIFSSGTDETIESPKTQITSDPTLNIELNGKVRIDLIPEIITSFYNLKKMGFRAGVSIFGQVSGTCSTANPKEGLKVDKEMGIGICTGFYFNYFRLNKEKKKCFDLFSHSFAPKYYDVVICPQDSTVEDTTDPETRSTSTGDPHLITFDKLSYSFMAAGEFTAVKSTADKFEVQVRQEEVKSRNSGGQVSFNTGLAIHTGDDIVCVYPQRLFINKVNVPLDFTNRTLTNGAKIDRVSNTLFIRTKNNDLVEVVLLGSDLDYYITPGKNRRNKITGIFGNYDGNPQNDLVKADGKPISNSYGELYPNFSDNWRIKQVESLFVYDTGKNTTSYTDRTFPRSPINITFSQRSEAEQICKRQGITDPAVLEGCIVDIVLTGDNNLAQRALNSEIASKLLSSFSIGNFSNVTTNIEFDKGAITNRIAEIDSKGSLLNWKGQDFDMRSGFETEFVVSTTNKENCARLLFWVFDALSETKEGYPLTIANQGNGKNYVSFLNKVNNFELPVNIFDGNKHKIKIQLKRSLSSQIDDNIEVKLYIDNMSRAYDLPKFLYDRRNNINFMYPGIGASATCGAGKLSIFNWVFQSL